MQGLTDKRISYAHVTARRAIGTKRNALIERARGRIIAQFDDDDYYSSSYLARMVRIMRESGAAFVKLYGFFLYSKSLRMCGYWDLLQRTGRHMVIPAARHELFMENDAIRAQVFAAFDAFITNQSS